MNTLTRNFVVSALLLLLGSTAFGQRTTKKYLKRNSDPKVITYGNQRIYARGIYAEDNKVFVGNSDGSVYYVNLENEKAQLLFKHPGLEEIRDLEMTENCLIAMHSGDNGKLIELDLKGGAHITYLTSWQGVFFDGLDVNGSHGFLMGDPSGGSFSLFRSDDQGSSWEACPGKIQAHKGEAGFAASGTNVQVLDDGTFVFVSGGEKSRFFKSADQGATWEQRELPYYPGESTGAYSMCFANDSVGVIVGGDYKDPSLSMNTCFYTADGGESWFNPFKSVRGYRSCVFYHNGIFYACGRNGIDFSLNNGQEWIPFADGTYYSLTTNGEKLIATAPEGTIKLFDLIEPEK